MVGRKGVVPPSDIIDTILTFKERVVLKNVKNEMCKCFLVYLLYFIWSENAT